MCGNGLILATTTLDLGVVIHFLKLPVCSQSSVKNSLAQSTINMVW